MKNKKGGAGIIIGIIAGVLVMGVIITLLVIASQKGWFDGKKPEQPLPTINLYLKATDKDSGEQVQANYVLDYGGIKVSEGILESKDWTEIKVPQALIHVYCWNKDHYLVKASKIFSPEEIQANSSKFSCDMVKIGDISVTSTGDLSRDVNTVTLNVSSTGWYYRLGICTSWTAGIIYAKPTNELLICDSGNWVNWSFYNASTKQYTLLPQNEFRCGEDRTEQCEAVEGNKCRLLSQDPPFRYKGKVDDCFYTGQTLDNGSTEIGFEVKTLDNKNSLDQLNFYFFDMDRRFSNANQDWEWESEKDGVNVGNPIDANYTIYYQK